MPSLPACSHLPVLKAPPSSQSSGRCLLLNLCSSLSLTGMASPSLQLPLQTSAALSMIWSSWEPQLSLAHGLAPYEHACQGWVTALAHHLVSLCKPGSCCHLLCDMRCLLPFGVARRMSSWSGLRAFKLRHIGFNFYLCLLGQLSSQWSTLRSCWHLVGETRVGRS